jgi:hypothetical protein
VTTPWWAAFGPAETQVSCGGHQHVIRWADGRLTAANHPDAEGELVMAALGGEPPRCVQLVQAWGAREGDLEVLAIGPRSAADRVVATMPGDVEELWPGLPPHLVGHSLWPNPRRPAMFASAVAARRRRTVALGHALLHGHPARGSRPMIAGRPRAAFGVGLVRARHAFFQQGDPAARRAHARATELHMLFALGSEFQWRLSGAVAAAWSGGQPGRDPAAARPALTAALTGRLAPVAQAWLGADPDRVEVTVHDGDGWGQLSATPAAPAGAGQRPGLTAALPPDWLARVWAPGLALVAGRLVVAVPEAQWPRARVLALSAPGSEPAPMDVQWEAGHWRPAPA